MKDGIQQAKLQYTYDENNNITEIRNSSNFLLTGYEYDGLNRLIREIIPADDTITIYTYDNDGNITAKKKFGYNLHKNYGTEQLRTSSAGITIAYNYSATGNKDRLLSYNGSVGDIQYDSIGNPDKWFKHDSTSSALGYNLTWSHVRELSSITDGDKTYAYSYNDRGIRVKKSANGTVHEYYVDGSRIIAETRTTGSTVNKLNYYYSQTGVCGFSYNGSEYYYQKNIQGDITHILDSNGNVVVKYYYDAWGVCKTLNPNGTLNSSDAFIGNINPFRYRGYYYDAETGLFYVTSRYYDPEVGRFISPDDIEYLDPETINGINLYAYAGNNPVMNIDPDGHAFFSFLIGLAITWAVTTIASQIVGANIVNGVGLAITGGIALVTGLMAISLLTSVGWIVGGITAVAGLATLVFASAELQQGFTGNNWIKDAGMSDGWYNGLMIVSSTVATLGSVASTFTYNMRINTIQKVGKIDDYYGIKFTQKAPSGNLRVRSLTLHPNHNGHGIHWQLNKINPLTGSHSALARWSLLLRRLLGGK